MTQAASLRQPSLPAPSAARIATASAEAPPSWVPGEHFAAALVFFVLGGLGLAFVASDLASGAFFLPRVVAVVHLFVLGFVTLSMFGALCQFLPVAVGRPIQSLVCVQLSFTSHIAGLSLFVIALLTANRGLLHAGAGLLALAFTAFAGNLIATLKGATDRSVTFWALAFASLFLGLTPVYGLILALNLHGDLALADRFTLVATHAHVAIVGFFFLVIVGVAHRLLPMFLLAHGASERPAWISVGLLAAGASLFALPIAHKARLVVAGSLSLAGIAAFLVQAHAFYRTRRRRSIDPGMRMAQVGLFGIALGALLSPFALSRGLSEPRLLVTYFIVLLGALSLFVAGHYYKIVPFLVWYHRFGPLVGKRKVPKVADLLSENAALTTLALLTLGWAGIAVGAYSGSAVVIRGSALVFTAGAALELFVIANIARRKVA